MKVTLLKLTAIAFMALVLTTSVRAEKLLCLVGDATRSGWDNGNASPMIQDATDPAVFHYDAWLNTGELKFILENGDWVPSWAWNADATELIKRTTYDDPDLKYSITTAGNYSITVDTLNLTVSIAPMEEIEKIEFNTVFMVGDATPNGWTITDATQLFKSTTSPFEFTYTGPMATGELKFPVNRKSDWSQDFFVKESDTQMQLVTGGDVKWNITEAGEYMITMNTKDLSIDIQKQTTTIYPLVSVEDIALKSTVVNSELNVKNLNSFKYNIYNVCGKSMIAGNTTNGTVDVSNLQKGIYLLKANSQVFKFIKK